MLDDGAERRGEVKDRVWSCIRVGIVLAMDRSKALSDRVVERR